MSHCAQSVSGYNICSEKFVILYRSIEAILKKSLKKKNSENLYIYCWNVGGNRIWKRQFSVREKKKLPLPYGIGESKTTDGKNELNE